MEPRVVRDGTRERRAMRRFDMRLPASVRVPGIPFEFSSETENISAQGIFFQIDRWMNEGAQVEVTMDFPSQITMSDPVRIKFQARVVRVEPKGKGMLTGVAAAIEEYQVIGAQSEAGRDFTSVEPQSHV